MKKENMVDITIYQAKTAPIKPSQHKKISEELEKAIERLIYQLRELGPSASR